jgi:hypothetical protein
MQASGAIWGRQQSDEDCLKAIADSPRVFGAGCSVNSQRMNSRYFEVDVRVKEIGFPQQDRRCHPSSYGYAAEKK